MALSYPDTNDLTQKIIGCAIEVHRHLGPGLLESVYEQCLCWEMLDEGLSVDRQRPIAITYKSHRLDCLFRPDLLVGGTVIIEVKHLEKTLPVREAQLLTYLKLTGLHVGLLFNFNSTKILDGTKRVSN